MRCITVSSLAFHLKSSTVTFSPAVIIRCLSKSYCSWIHNISPDIRADVIIVIFFVPFIIVELCSCASKNTASVVDAALVWISM